MFLQFYDNITNLVGKAVDYNIRDTELDEICKYGANNIVERDEITFLRNQNVALNYFGRKVQN